MARWIKRGFRTKIEMRGSVRFVLNLLRRIKKRIKMIKAPQKTEKERIEVREEPKKLVQGLKVAK